MIKIKRENNIRKKVKFKCIRKDGECMKKLVRSISIMLILSLSIVTGGAMPETYNQVKANTVKSKTKVIKLNKKKATMRVNETLKLKLKNAKAKKVKWKSSRKKVARVTKNGRVKALKKGKVVISAKYKGKKYKCKITVKNVKRATVEQKSTDKITLKQAVYLTDSLYDNDNIIISPLSLNMALGMVANATTKDALKDLEGYLGKNLAKYNKYALSQMKRAEKDDMLSLANGVWYKNTCTINPAFEKAITNYYKGEIYAAPLDATTVNDINQWCDEKTDGMIKKVINEIPRDAVSILANALLFEGKWTVPFKAEHTKNSKFTTFSGKKINVKMMNGTVRTYFENEHAVGFEKTYGKNGEYSFIAILPKKKGNFKISDLKVNKLLATETNKYDVDIYIPKFTYAWNDELDKVLCNTKIKSLYEHKKNPLGNLFINFDENICVETINQSCKIIMDEEGTKAAAVTTIMAHATTALTEPRERKTVKLNRPFAYIIRDNTTKEVMFMGKAIDIDQ